MGLAQGLNSGAKITAQSYTVATAKSSQVSITPPNTAGVSPHVHLAYPRVSLRHLTPVLMRTGSVAMKPHLRVTVGVCVSSVFADTGTTCGGAAEELITQHSYVQDVRTHS